MNCKSSIKSLYQEHQNIIIRNSLRLFACYSLVASLLRFLINGSKTNEIFFSFDVFHWQIMNLSFLGLLTIYSFLQKTAKKHSQIFLAALQAYLYICFSVWSNKENIIQDSFFSQHLLLLPLASNMDWKFSSASSLIANAFNIIYHFLQGKATTSLSCFVVASFIESFIFISAGSFLKQRSHQELLSLHEKDKSFLFFYQNLIKRVLPSSILIIRDKRVVFQNQQTKRLLRYPKFKKIEDILNEIVITNFRKDSGCPNQIESTEETGKLRLFDYILKNTEHINALCGFHKISGKIEELNTNDTCQKFDQTQTLLEIKIAAIIWEGEESHIVILSEDYRGEELYKLSNQSKYKDTLLATVSHDLRTPLNGVIGMLEMALDSIYDKALKKCLTIALRSSRLLLFMINDILDFSLISNGKLGINPIEFDIVQCVKEVAKLIKFQAKKKGLRFEFDSKFLEERKPLIRSDPNRVKQVILNLLSNALKFTQTGFIKISVEPLETPNSIKLRVEDSGIGIKEEDIPKLFKLFGKIEGQESMKINSHGIGLGLAISQSLIRRLNNDSGEEIKVESEYGKGTVFHFTLKNYRVLKSTDSQSKLLALSNSFKSDCEEEKEEEDDSRNLRISRLYQTNFRNLHETENRQIYHKNPSNNRRPKNILIVDDDQINIMVFSTYLNTFSDCKYELAFNGKQAVDLVFRNAKEKVFYDLIFMDCNMPIMDGFEASQKIVEMEKQELIPHVPIIASTANTSQSDHDKCYRNGMVDFMSKPFGKQIFRERIDKYCKF